MAMPPDRYLQIERSLEQPLDKFVNERRAVGMSWRRIANEILLASGEDVSYETLRMWFQGREPVSGAA
jgi:hypothetical protein